MRQPSITTMKLERRKHFKMTKWLKCTNITPDNKKFQTQKTHNNSVAETASHPGQYTKGCTVQGIATVHPHSTGTNTWHNHTQATHTPPNTAKEHENGPTQYVPKGIYFCYGTMGSSMPGQVLGQTSLLEAARHDRSW